MVEISGTHANPQRVVDLEKSLIKPEHVELKPLEPWVKTAYSHELDNCADPGALSARGLNLIACRPGAGIFHFILMLLINSLFTFFILNIIIYHYISLFFF